MVFPNVLCTLALQSLTIPEQCLGVPPVVILKVVVVPVLGEIVVGVIVVALVKVTFDVNVIVVTTDPTPTAPFPAKAHLKINRHRRLSLMSPLWIIPLNFLGNVSPLQTIPTLNPCPVPLAPTIS